MSSPFSNVSFTAAASGDPSPTVQWQVSTDGGRTFSPISGATSTTLTLSSVSVSMSGNEYEAVFTNPAGSVTTSAATLTVTPLPVTLTGGRVYNGTQTADGSVLSISNEATGNDLTLSGYATLAGANAGPETITDVSHLTLVGTSAANYTLAGASGSVTIAELPVTLMGSRVYNGTQTADGSILSVSDGATGDDITLSGSAGLAGANAGPEPITNVSNLTLGGNSAANYTLVGATGSVTISPSSTTTTLSLLNNPAVPGQLVTFTAVIAPVAPGGGTPTGTVTFTSGSTTLQTVPLVGGQASLTTSYSTAGSPVSRPPTRIQTATTPRAARTRRRRLSWRRESPSPGPRSTSSAAAHRRTSPPSSRPGPRRTGRPAWRSPPRSTKLRSRRPSPSRSRRSCSPATRATRPSPLASTLTLPTTVTAGNGNDAIVLSGGNNTVALGGGNDAVAAGGGNNSVTVGNGNDVILLGNGNDTVTAGNGNDGIVLGGGNNTVALGGGNDAVAAGGGNDSVTVGNGNDVILLGNGNDTVTAGNGIDGIVLGGGNDAVALGGGNDAVAAGSGNDTVTAGNGNDVVLLGNGNDTIGLGGGSNSDRGQRQRHHRARRREQRRGRGQRHRLRHGRQRQQPDRRRPGAPHDQGRKRHEHPHRRDGDRQEIWRLVPPDPQRLDGEPDRVEPGGDPVAVHGQLQHEVRQHPDGRQRHRLVLLPVPDDLEQEVEGLPELTPHRSQSSRPGPGASRGPGVVSRWSFHRPGRSSPKGNDHPFHQLEIGKTTSK